MKNLTLVFAGCLLMTGCMCTDAATVGGNNTRPRDGGTLADGGSVAGTDGGVTSSDAGIQNETCGNGFDDNNNGIVDEGCACVKDATQTCWTGEAANRHLGACRVGRGMHVERCKRHRRGDGGSTCRVRRRRQREI